MNGPILVLSLLTIFVAPIASTDDCTKVPPGVTNFIVWTRLPILPPTASSEFRDYTLEYGLSGLTGVHEQLLSSIPRVVVPPQEAYPVLDEVHKFVSTIWPEDVWETAWFVNPLVCWTLISCLRVNGR